MQKYIKNDLTNIYYFDDKVDVTTWIDLKQYRVMTEEEVDRHENPNKYLTASQRYQLYLSSLKPLSRKQFKLVLLDSGLLDDLELAISNIEDATEKKRIEIEYTESTEFARTSESVKTMFALINQTEEQINELWEKALAL